MSLMIALLLLTRSAQASDLSAQRYGDGYVMRFVQDGAVHYWGMPDLVDLSYFDHSWLPVTDTPNPIGSDGRPFSSFDIDIGSGQLSFGPFAL